jgi:hypothetical protein
MIHGVKKGTWMPHQFPLLFYLIKIKVLKIPFKFMNNFCPDYFTNYLSSTVPNVKSTRAKTYQLLPVNTLNVYEKNCFKNASQSYANMTMT